MNNEEEKNLDKLLQNLGNIILIYQKRIEKAVEYIEQYDEHIEGYYYSKEHKRFLVEENVKNELLNILNGKGDE